MKIRGEQDELNEERDILEKTLKSAARLKTLIKKEILEDTESYGDDRRTVIVARDAAHAFDETQIVASEPVTVVLSQAGYARAAKGHEIDPTTLSYRSGDHYLAAAQGRSNQLAMFIDSTGRVYSVLAGTLPSARGQGEPLSSRFRPPDGAAFCGAMIGDNEQKYLLASDAGYGFIATLGDLVSRNKAGKAILRVPPGGKVVVPAAVPRDSECLIAAVSSIGRLLLFEMEELPELAKGKGNKLINIPGPKYKSGEEKMVAAAVVPERNHGSCRIYPLSRTRAIASGLSSLGVLPRSHRAPLARASMLRCAAHDARRKCPRPASTHLADQEVGLRHKECGWAPLQLLPVSTLPLSTSISTVSSSLATGLSAVFSSDVMLTVTALVSLGS